ncbi:MAG: hypothetical protein LBU90_08260 [Bacteroidales bacterium]|jgi:hypothetical protein|nr:hypothetical protein [Bacteroidales bacterium]
MIKSTARKAGNYLYLLTQGVSNNNTWNPQMGHGVLDAYAAVQAAQQTICQTPVVNFTNQTVSTNTTVTSCGDIFVKDVLIKSGAKLILDAEGEIIMEGDLQIENGAEFEMW